MTGSRAPKTTGSGRNLARGMFSGVRRGIVLVIVIVTVAVIAVLSTVIFASLSTGVDRIVQTADILFRFKTEIIGTPPSFFERIRVYPGHLIDLIEPITTADVNSCGEFYKASPDVNNWQGPYHLVPFNPAEGYVLALGIQAQDATARTTFTNGAPALAIVLVGIQRQDAEALKLKIDGSTGDTIAFTLNESNRIIVHYRMPSTGAC